MARTAFGRPLRSVVFDGAIAFFIAVCAAAAAIWVRPAGWGLALIGVAMAVAMLFRRTRPTGAGAAVAALALLQTLLGWRSQAFDLAVLVAMYSVVKYADRLRRDGAVAAAAVVVGIVLDSRFASSPWWATSIFETLVSGAVWLVALNLRTRRLYVLSLEERAATLERERDALARAAVAEERTRIARELHDVVAHGLAVMIAQADGAAYTIDRDPGAARGAIEVVAGTGREALQEMRRLVGVLRAAAPSDSPVDADTSGIGTDPHLRRPALGELNALLDRSRVAGLVVRDAVYGEPAELPAGVDLTIYRIVQESLTNALKHAGPGARVELAVDYSRKGEVGVRIVDDGGDGVAGTPPPSGGHGLIGMRERVAVYGGCFHAGPRLAGGWEVVVRLPLPPARPEPRPEPRPESEQVTA